MDLFLFEEEEAFAKLVSFEISREGHAVTLARAEADAKELLKSKPWAAILLDLGAESPWSLLSEIVEIETLSRVPLLVILSAEERRSLPSQLFASGRELRVLRKPIEAGTLSASIKQLLNY